MEKAYDNQIESPQRRAFLKTAGLAGLALAGGAAGLGGLSGCAHVDFTNYDYNSLAKNYEKSPMQINSIYDFALSGEELGEMRFSKGAEKTGIPLFDENPLRGRENSYPTKERRGDTPVCEEWLLAENVGQNWYPWYRITTFAKKFHSKEEFLIAEKNVKNMPPQEMDYLLKMLHYGRQSSVGIDFNIFSKSPFIVEFIAGGLIFSGKGPEHAKRTRLYQAKRGLNHVTGNFKYL